MYNSDKENDFTSSVRATDSKIKQPTQRGFKKERWKKAFQSFKNASETDQKLFDAGLWFNERLEEVRQELSGFSDKSIDIETLRRAYVAMINRDYWVAHLAYGKSLNKRSDIIADELSDIKLPLGPNNTDIAVLNVIESALSAVRHPLSETFKNNSKSTNKQTNI